MTDKNLDQELEGFFHAARDGAPRPSPDFMATLYHDADVATLAMPEPKPQRSLGPWSALRALWDRLGGWPAGLGLATAACAGVMIGISPPEAVLDITTVYLGGDSFDDLMGFNDDSFLLLEGNAS